jgi:hypothetical protein
MNSKQYDENEIQNTTLLMVQNTNDYVWIKFMKCCGYSIMFPFVLDDSIQSLYRHIDLLWKNCSINLIWFHNKNNKNEKVVITRGDQRTIRQFVNENLIYRQNFGIIYSVYFDVDTHKNYLYNHNHNNDNFGKDIN